MQISHANCRQIPKLLSEETVNFFILKLVMKIVSALCLIFTKVLVFLTKEGFLDAFSVLAQNW